MALSLEKLRALEYAPFVATDTHDPSIFLRLPEVVGHSIPQDYLEFLRAYPSTGMFDVEGGVVVNGLEKLSGNHDGKYGVSMLFAACSDDRYDIFAVAQQPYYEGDSIPRHLLQIGEDLFGNAFCIELRYEGFGKVYFWDHEHSRGESGLYLVANDFGSFIDALEVGDSVMPT